MEELTALPVEDVEDIKKIMNDPELLKYYASKVTLISPKACSGVSEMCESMVGKFNALTRERHFRR